MDKKDNLYIKFGYWSALICIVTFVLFTICYIAILMINPLYIWTNITDYASYTQQTNQMWKYLAQFSMMVFGISYLVLLSSIFEYASENKKILARVSLYFGIIFTMLISIHYFVQLSTVRVNILRGNLEGLQHFLQSNPTSAISSINMLGWTLFLGLSSLFIAPVFTKEKLERIIMYSFLANGIICIIGGIAYIFDLVVLVFLCMNIGMGIAVLIASIALFTLFRRLEKREVPSV